MVYQELVNYIRAARSSGVPDEQVKGALAQIGWKADDLSAAFTAADAMSQKSGIMATTPQPAAKPVTSTTPVTLASLNRPAIMTAVQTKPVEVKPDAIAQQTAQTPQNNSSDSPMVATSWTSFWTEPAKTFSRERYYASFGRTIGNWLLSFFLFFGIVALVLAAVNVPVGSALTKTIPGGSGGTLAVLTSGIYMVLVVLFSFVLVDWLIFMSFLYFALGKLLGGKGSYSVFTHLLSVGAASTVLAYLLALTITVILCAVTFIIGGALLVPIGAAIALLINIAFFLYLNANIFSAFTGSKLKGALAALGLGLFHAIIIIGASFISLTAAHPSIISTTISSIGFGAFVGGIIAFALMMQLPLMAIGTVMLSLKEANGFNFMRAFAVHLILFMLFGLIMVIGLNEVLGHLGASTGLLALTSIVH